MPKLSWQRLLLGSPKLFTSTRGCAQKGPSLPKWHLPVLGDVSYQRVLAEVPGDVHFQADPCCPTASELATLPRHTFWCATAPSPPPRPLGNSFPDVKQLIPPNKHANLRAVKARGQREVTVHTNRWCFVLGN